MVKIIHLNDNHSSHDANGSFNYLRKHILCIAYYDGHVFN